MHYLMSCGEKSGGKLGLGPDVPPSQNSFTTLADLKNMDIKSIAARKKHCLALTSTNKVPPKKFNKLYFCCIKPKNNHTQPKSSNI